MKSELIQFAPLFAGLNEEDRAALDAAFLDGQCAAGSTVLSAGERSEAIYLIGQGFASLTTSGGQGLATLGPGSILGEASLLGATPMDVNAEALADLSYWKLTDERLRELILQHPSVGIRLSRNFGNLVVQMEDYLAQRLASTPELSTLPPQTLQTMAKQLEPVDVHAGSVVYYAGDMPSGLYLVESGLVELRSEIRSDGQGNGDGTRFAQAGRLFGGASLLTGKPALETATANDECQLWLLSADVFQTISTQQPGLRRAMASTVRSPLGREDRAQAVLWLAQMPMFREVSPDTLRAVAGTMQLQHVPAGERVYMMGDAGDALYLIESGEIEQTAQNASGVVEEVGRISSGGFFGEMGLLTGQMCAENASAIRHTNLWVLHKTDLDDLASNYPEIGKALSQGVATKLAIESDKSDVERFRMFALLADLNLEELERVAGYLEPMRYRAGEQIYRATGPADMLFLLETGQVRIQPLGGGSWMLGPGEEFGERALLTNQPHNATAMAESDVDVWTLTKNDFDMLMGLYPGLALSMSRILTQRLTQMELGQTQESTAPYMAQDAQQGSPAQSVFVADAPSAPASQSTYAGTMPPPAAGQPGFVQWFTDLSAFGKVRLAVFVLLLIWLVGIAAPSALMYLLQGSTSVASGADLGRSSLFNAVNAVYAVGSYELASKDENLAQVLAMADKEVPPTATPTSPPTVTPIPTSTLLPTATPRPTNTPRPTATAVPVFQAAAAAPEPTKEPEVQVASVAPRAWDPRLDRLGVHVEDAPAAPGQQYWRVSETRWEDEQEAAGRHHIYVEVVDENGERITGQPVTVFWSDGNFTTATEDKNPPDYAFNYQMYAAGNAYNVKVEGMPSETLRGAGMGDVERPNYGIHTAFYITFQRATK